LKSRATVAAILVGGVLTAAVVIALRSYVSEAGGPQSRAPSVPSDRGEPSAGLGRSGGTTRSSQTDKSQLSHSKPPKIAAAPAESAEGGSQLPNEAEIASNSSSYLADPRAVVGREFPISDSVRASCIRNREGTACEDETIDMLERMAKEPRDLLWAPQTERRLSDLIRSRTEEVEIRAVECRTSICAIEVASTFGPYLAGLDADALLSRNLREWGGMHAHEPVIGGARTTITVLVYERR
jgi:hypothetical protein